MTELRKYVETIYSANKSVCVTDIDGAELDAGKALGRLIDLVRNVREKRQKLFFIGNGGSAGIASHLAIDYTKNGRIPALAFNDAAALTCLGNDFGYERVFAEQIKVQANPGDVLIAISSSGESANILEAVAQADSSDVSVITFSGFLPSNSLRKMGEQNWYVDSTTYGVVEITHLTLCHAILDIEMGWEINT